MKFEEANEIFKTWIDFTEIGEKLTKFFIISGVPESFLPYPRDVLENALNVVAEYYSDIKDSEKSELIQKSTALLAFFEKDSVAYDRFINSASLKEEKIKEKILNNLKNSKDRWDGFKTCNKKIQTDKVFKICPICGEQIKYTAVKCGFCNEHLNSEKENKDFKSNNSPKASEEDKFDKDINKNVFLKNKNNTSSVVSFVFGLISVFLAEFSIFPIIAIVSGIISITKYNNSLNIWWLCCDNRNKAFSIIGLVLGFVYLIVGAHLNY